jgi:chorismate dehydratase
VCAVSYLNTAPLVYGLQHATDFLRRPLELSFALPAECADRLAEGAADVGIVPSATLNAQPGLQVIAGAGIACRGPVRSILLLSNKPLRDIRKLALDTSSRTSVLLARILLAERFGAQPECIALPPVVPAMLEQADAALLIGDPALRVDPERAAPYCLDLGEEWVRFTGLPMVFAVWAARPGIDITGLPEVFTESCRQGLAHLDQIAAAEAPSRGIDMALAREYLHRHVRLLLDDRDYQGMDLFLRYARQYRGVENSTVEPVNAGG